MNVFDQQTEVRPDAEVDLPPPDASAEPIIPGPPPYVPEGPPPADGRADVVPLDRATALAAAACFAVGFAVVVALVA